MEHVYLLDLGKSRSVQHAGAKRTLANKKLDLDIKIELANKSMCNHLFIGSVDYVGV